MAHDMATGISAILALINRLAKWLLLLSIIWLCWNSARIIWLILAPPQAPNLPLTEIQSLPESTVNTDTVLAIFDEDRPKPEVVQRPAPKVNLIGVMLGVPRHLSSAMLEVDGTISNYRIDEPLGDTGYSLVAVEWDKATIEDGSSHEVTLSMPERMSLDQELDFKGGQSSRRNNTSASRARSRRDLDSATDEQSEHDDYDVDEDRASVAAQNSNGADNSNNTATDNSPQAQIDKAIDALKQNPAGYLSRMGVMATGEGYQVTDAMPAGLKNRLGLESGDRVISVNGNSVGSNPTADADMLAQVKQSGEAHIEVKRGEQVITIRQQF